MSTDPYKSGKISTDAYYKKRVVTGGIAVILDMRLENRGLELINQPSRCLLKNEIHELIFTISNSKLGEKVNESIAYVAFFEVEEGGVVIVGDTLTIGGKVIGSVLGFDETHSPNHLNIIIRNDNIKTGKELKIKLEDKVCFFQTHS